MWAMNIPLVVATACVVFLLSGCAPNEPKMTPEAAWIDVLKEPIDRENLAPHTQYLLAEAEAEAGRIAGADSSKYAAELAKADDVQKGKQWTLYLFFLDDNRE